MAQIHHLPGITISLAIVAVLQTLFLTPGNCEVFPSLNSEDALVHSVVKRRAEQSSVAQHVLNVKPKQMQSTRRRSRKGQNAFNHLLNAKKLFSFSIPFELPSRKENRDDLALARVKALLEGSQNILPELYRQYKRKYKKTPKNERNSMKIFKNKLMKIAKHNLEARRGKHLWEMGINQFTDLTRKECIAGYTGSIPSPLETRKKSSKSRTRSKRQVELPTFINWADEGKVGPVWNQGYCNSCTMFALTSLVDSANAIANEVQIAPEGKDPRSPQQLLDCSLPTRDVCRDAAYPEDVVRYIHKYHLVSRDEYQQARDHQQKKCGIQAVERKLSNRLRLTMIPQGEEALKRAIVRGPCALGIHMVDFDYGNGIYDGNACGNNEINHEVLVVGYGTQGNVDYWIIKNSYGKGWGEQGYFRLIRNAGNICRIGTGRIYSAGFPRLPVLDRFKNFPEHV